MDPFQHSDRDITHPLPEFNLDREINQIHGINGEYVDWIAGVEHAFRQPTLPRTTGYALADTSEKNRIQEIHQGKSSSIPENKPC